MLRFTPPTRSYSGYIFDCDGTLVDSMPVHHAAWRHAFALHGAPFEFDWPLFMRRAGKPMDTTVAELNQEFGCDLPVAGVVSAQHAYFARHLEEMKPVVEVVAFARGLAGQAELSVASGGAREMVERSLEIVGIADLFAAVYTASDVTHGKPHPEMMLSCAEAMGVVPADCLVIEDGQSGIDAAEAAGMDWVRVESVGAPVP